MGKKKAIISTFLIILMVVVDLIKGLTLSQHLMEVTVEELFIKFTLIPMLFSLGVPFLATLICAERRIIILSYVFAAFLYLHNYIIIDSFFKPEVIAQVMKNSNMVQEGISISSSTDMSSMISTVIIIFAATSIGVYLGNKLNSIILRIRKGIN